MLAPWVRRTEAWKTRSASNNNNNNNNNTVLALPSFGSSRLGPLSRKASSPNPAAKWSAGAEAHLRAYPLLPLSEKVAGGAAFLSLELQVRDLCDALRVFAPRVGGVDIDLDA